jgi:hypothetical protein
MIISHRLRCIFIAVPKTATHAVRIALRPHMDDQDIEQVGLFVRKQSPFPELARRKHGHLTAVEIRKAVGPDVWSSYFKFAFVRNPWDRVVSNFFYFYRKQPQLIANPRHFLPQMLASPKERQRLLMLPQHTFLCDSGGQCRLNFVGRFESLQDDFGRVCERLGIPAAELEKVNSSRHEPWQTYFDSDSAELVRRWYGRDIELFDYDFNPDAPAAVEVAPLHGEFFA